MRRLLATISMVGLTGVAHADLRSFTQTYEYSTMPEGKTSLELWHTQGRSTWDADTAQSFEQVLEIEHGITDRWLLSFYTIFSQVSSSDAMTSEPFHFSEAKIETRYRLKDRGEWPVDVALYGEGVKAFGESLYELEGKLILQRDFGKVTVAVNPIVAIKFGKDAAETEPELGWAIGGMYQAHPKVRVGVETWGELEEDEVGAAIGPALSLAPAGNFWIAITAGFGLTDEADAFSGRAIIGIEL